VSERFWPRIAVVGTGTRGLGIAHVFASNGIPTVLVDDTAERTEAGRWRELELLSRLEKAVAVGDGPGFVTNRIQFALPREAAPMSRTASPPPGQVDEGVRSSFGFRLPFFGPFTIADMVGLDADADILATLGHGLGKRFATPAILQERVGAGDFDVKSGRGSLELSQAQQTASSNGDTVPTSPSPGRSRRNGSRLGDPPVAAA
jgi:3-hydroxybutyryl-CoA dehydrogenase